MKTTVYLLFIVSAITIPSSNCFASALVHFLSEPFLYQPTPNIRPKRTIDIYNPQYKIKISDLKKMKGNSPLHYAVCKNNIDKIKELIAQGTDINIVNQLNYSPLHFAVLANNLIAIELLYCNGFNFNICDEENQITPIHLAIRLKKNHIIEFFFNRNPLLVTLKDVNKNTPLHTACQIDDVVMVQYLLRMCNEAEVTLPINLKNAEDKAPLHIAVENQNYYLVQILLQHGADPRMQQCVIQTSGYISLQTPLETATKSHSDLIVSLLKKYLVIWKEK